MDKDMDIDTLTCHNCGALNALDSLYCAHCGKKLDRSQIEEHVKVKEVTQGAFHIKKDNPENVYSVERTNRNSASAYILKDEIVKYQINDQRKSLKIETYNNIPLGTAIKTGGSLFPEWSIKDNQENEIAHVGPFPIWKGEIKGIKETYTFSVQRDKIKNGFWMQVKELQAYDQIHDKIIKIIPSPMEKGLIVKQIPNKFEIQFDNEINELLAIGFLGIILKNYYHKPKPSGSIWMFNFSEFN